MADDHVCPVLTAWAVAEIYGILVSGKSVMARLPFWILQTCLSLFFTFSYFQARRSYRKWWSQHA